MPYTFDVVAWEGWDQRRHGGTPSSPQQAKGVKVLVTNPEDSGDTHQFWAFNTSPKNAFQDWAEWWVYVGALMTQHGMELADEPPPDDEPSDEGGYFYDEEDDELEEEPEPEKPSIVTRAAATVGKWVRRLFR